MTGDLRKSPQTKATFAHNMQAEVARLDAAQSAAIIERAASTWTEIAAMPSSVWIDEQTFNVLTESIAEVLSRQQARELYRRVGRVLIRNPIFAPIAESVVRLLGVGPHTFLKFAPHARASVVRHSGTLTYTKIGPQAAELKIANFPPSTWALGRTAVMLAGTWEGLVESAGGVPTVDTVDLDLDGGGCRYAISWVPSRK